MTRVLEGTLDAHSRLDLGRMPAAEVAAQHYDDEFAGYRSPREWWQIASLPGGQPVGFVIPARNDYNAIIAYIGVLPEHRGNGYIDDILAEGTRVLAAQGVPRIGAATDLTTCRWPARSTGPATSTSSARSTCAGPRPRASRCGGTVGGARGRPSR